jgi:hypothetical protein
LNLCILSDPTALLLIEFEFNRTVSVTVKSSQRRLTVRYRKPYGDP